MPPFTRTTNYTECPDYGFAIQVRFTTFLGKLRDFSVVLIKDDGINVYDISRYDTADGGAHRDRLGRTTGSHSQGKIWYDDMEPEDVLKFAKEDFKANYAKYDDYYQTH